MMRNKISIYFILFTASFCFSQTETQKIALTEIIAAIEQTHNVKFSYSVNDVQNIVLNAPNNTFSLAETIKYLNQNTLLNFNLLDDNRYITVSVLDKTINICGEVIELANNTKLLGASVIVEGTSIGSITNENGIFRLEDIPLNSTIKITFLGYKSQSFLAKELFTDGNGCSQITLQESNLELNQILITKFLTTGLQKRLDGSTQLNTKKFGILPGLTDPDILQSIQALPGVESTNESIANINVRGGTNDQNLMLWDNIKMYHSGHFFGLISAYNPNLTNKVIVIKNGTSSEFSDGVSSTVNMFTKNEISNKFSGGAGLNLVSTDAFFEIPIARNLELHISGRRSITDAFTSPTYDNYFERSFQDSDITNGSEDVQESSTTSDFLFYDYTAKLLFDLNENQKFRVNIIGINNSLDYTESFTNSSNETESKTSNLTQENIGSGVNWNSTWSDTFSTELIGYYSKYNVDATDFRIETDQRLTQANEVLETGAKLKTYLKINENLSLLNGYQFNETGILNETTVSAPSYDRTKKDVLLNHALFSEAEYHKNKTYFRVGVRANYFQNFKKLLFEPRLNIRQKLNNQFAVKLEGELKNQSATQIIDFQDDFLGVENRRWILANEETIPISTSKQASFGLEFNQNNLTVDITGFYKTVDGITASNQGFYNNFQFLNAKGSYIAKGVEFLANKTTNNFSAWLSYTFSNNDYTFDAFTPSEFPNNVDIRHSLSIAFNYDIFEDFKISVGGIMRSGQPYTKPVEGNETVDNGGAVFVNYDAPNAENLDDFKRLDASLSYRFNISSSSEAQIRAGVINITNQRNVINRYYQVDPNDTDKTIQIDNLSLKMTPNISLRINF
jgi:outer membrane receptor for ferrienterochelin and colicin